MSSQISTTNITSNTGALTQTGHMAVVGTVTSTGIQLNGDGVVTGDFDVTGDLDVSTNINATGSYFCNAVETLSSTTLGSNVVNSSLTSVGNLDDLGIGTGSPTELLDITSSGANANVRIYSGLSGGYAQHKYETTKQKWNVGTKEVNGNFQWYQNAGASKGVCMAINRDDGYVEMPHGFKANGLRFYGSMARTDIVAMTTGLTEGDFAYCNDTKGMAFWNGSTWLRYQTESL